MLNICVPTSASISPALKAFSVFSSLFCVVISSRSNFSILAAGNDERKASVSSSVPIFFASIISLPHFSHEHVADVVKPQYWHFSTFRFL